MTKDYTKIGIAVTLFIFLIFLSAQIVKFSGRRHAARDTYETAKKEYDNTVADHEILKEDFRYYSDPENLSKELRTRFNYTLPGERILILVQEGASTTDSD